MMTSQTMKVPCLLSVVVAAVLSSVGNPASGSSYLVQDYFPLTPGLSTNYHFWGPANEGKYQDFYYQNRIADQPVVIGPYLTWVSQNIGVPDEDGLKLAEYFAMDASGVLLCKILDGGDVDVYSPPIRFLPAVLTTGQTYSSQVLQTDYRRGGLIVEGTYSWSVTVIGIETVAVASGTFEALRLDWSRTTDAQWIDWWGDFQVHLREVNDNTGAIWLRAGHGLVKYREVGSETTYRDTGAWTPSQVDYQDITIEATPDPAGSALLELTSADAMVSYGYECGPFTPGHTQYTLTNRGGQPLDWAISGAPAWLVLSSTTGTLAPGTSVTVTARIAGTTPCLAPGGYTGTLTFTNTTSHIGDGTRPVSLTVRAASTPPWQREPSPPAPDLLGVWGSGDEDVFAVGRSGTILHYDGETWVQMSSSTSAELRGVWGNDSEFVVVPGYDASVSEGLVVGYNGEYWATLRSDRAWLPQGVWGSGRGSVYAVGYDDVDKAGLILHAKEGGYPTQMAAGTTVTLYAIWGRGDSDIFAVGDGGTILHYNGTAWSVMDSGTTQCLRGVWGAATGEVYAVGDGGTILRLVGTAWVSVSSSTTSYLRSVWGSDAEDVYAVGDDGTILHFDGSAWSGMASGVTATLNAVWGSAAGDVYAVGDAGTILHFGGARPGFLRVCSTESDLLAAGPEGGPFNPSSTHYTIANPGDEPIDWSLSTTQTWLAVSSTGGTLLPRTSITVTVSLSGQAADLPAGDYSGGLLLTNVTNHVGDEVRGASLRISDWEVYKLASSDALFSIWGSGPGDVYAIGFNYQMQGRAFRSDGIEWSAVDVGSGSGILGIWGSGADDVYLSCYDGTILHYDGTTWNPMSSGTTRELFGLWGSGPSDVYAVGTNGTILHCQDQTWSSMTSGTQDMLIRVWGSRADDVYAVGMNGTILHYDGATWSRVSGLTVPSLLGLWGSAADDVFVVGDQGTILHYDGITWSTMASGSTAMLLNVWGSGPQDVYAVGEQGTILHYDGSAWSSMESGIREALYGIWGSGPDDVYAVSEQGTILHLGPRLGLRLDSVYIGHSKDHIAGAPLDQYNYPDGPWSFVVQTYGTGIRSVSVTTPTGGTFDLTYGNGRWVLSEDFLTKAQLLGKYPMGTYRLTFNDGQDTVDIVENQPEPLGLADIQYPSHDAKNVPVANPQFGWTSCEGLCSRLCWYVQEDRTGQKLLPKDGQDPGVTSWVYPEWLLPGRTYWFCIDATNPSPEPHMVRSAQGRDVPALTQFFYFNQVQFTTLPDITGDGHVDLLDLLAMAGSWAKASSDPGFDDRCDFNNDGSVNVIDLLILADNWGT